MKKLFLLLILPISFLYGDAKIYTGINVGYQYEIVHTSKKKGFNNSSTAGLKLGYGDRQAYAFEFSFNYLKNESDIFSTDDSNRYDFNIELLKSFDFDLFFIPFVKVGFGTGFMTAERELQKDITYGSFNGGLGTFIPFNEYFDLEIGYTYKRVAYEKFNLINRYEKPTADQSTTYIGCNFRY